MVTAPIGQVTPMQQCILYIAGTLSMVLVLIAPFLAITAPLFFGY
jgi:hypothetical protein